MWSIYEIIHIWTAVVDESEEIYCDEIYCDDHSSLSCERYRMNRSTVCTKLGHVFTCTCPRLDENDGIIKINVFGYEKTTTTKKNSLSPFMSVKKNLKTVWTYYW